jgi:hypothetical protein
MRRSSGDAPAQRLAAVAALLFIKDVDSRPVVQETRLTGFLPPGARVRTSIGT